MLFFRYSLYFKKMLGYIYFLNRLPICLETSLFVVQSLSHIRLFVTPWTAAHQASLSFTTPRTWSNSCFLSWWCHPIISSSVVPFFSCLQSFSASGSFPVSSLFASGGQNIGASASASVLLMNIQDWFPLGLTGLISYILYSYAYINMGRVVSPYFMLSWHT